NESVVLINNIYKKNFGLQNFITFHLAFQNINIFFVYNLAHFYLEKKMSKLNKDVLFLLFEELQDDSKSLFSCLLVNKLWCETVVPILWRNPWCYYYNTRSSLYYIITFYLPDNVKEFLTRQGIQLPSVPTQPLLFDY